MCAKMIVEWITDCLAYIRKNGLARIVPTPQAEEARARHAPDKMKHNALWREGASTVGRE